MFKFVTIGRVVSLLVTLLSTIPLFIHYLMHTAPKNQMIVHIHVWVGCLFFIFALVSMIMQKKQRAKQKA